LFQINFSTLDFKIDVTLDMDAYIDVVFLKEFHLENFDFLVYGNDKKFDMILSLNAKIFSTDISLKWLPKNETVRYEVDIG